MYSHSATANSTTNAEAQIADIRPTNQYGMVELEGAEVDTIAGTPARQLHSSSVQQFTTMLV
jgi:hypothetical protein